jgi:serine/threonine-protein kinase
MSNEVPQLLGARYRILQRLGSGGMADVFHARDLNLQRDVAVKVLRDTHIDDPAFQARFLQEARDAANLTHPNIVTIYDFGHDAGRYFLVMEYMPGTDLKTLVRRRGALSVEEAVGLMVQVCAGVGYAHRAGIVHCDLKPHNVLVSEDGRVKITDFGIARALATIEPDEGAKVVWGSPKYSAPEQSAGKAPSPSSDVYSLGVMLFEILTGRPPFNADDPAQLAVMHQTTPPPSPKRLRPEIPPALNQILLKILSKEPAARYRTADQLGRVLKAFVSDQDPPGEDLHIPEPQPVQHDPEAFTAPLPVEERASIDWVAILLALLAFLAVGGLIPLWLWACLLYPACPIAGW